MSQKWDAYMKRGEKRLSALLAKEGSDSDVYKKALENYTLKNQWYKDMVDATTLNIAHANETALGFVKDQLPEMYAINYNQMARVYKETGAEDIGIRFDLVDANTVKHMIQQGDIDMPNQEKRLSIPKDQRWNTKQINSSVLQGIIQGESIRKIAKRLEPIMDNNRKAAIRNARTLVTGAESRGRLDSYKQAEEDGIVMNKVWMATPDGHTRDWHVDLDGQEVGVEEEFIDGKGNALMYPGDPGGSPETVYNCRCCLTTHIIGFTNPNTGELSLVDYEAEPTLHDRAMNKERERRAEKKAVKMGTIKAGNTKPKPDTEGAMRSVPKNAGETLYTAVEKTNPKYNEGGDYKINCANCAVAVELQQRGYDVQALPRDKSTKIDRFWYNNKHGNGSWTDSFTEIDGASVGATRKANVEQKIAERMRSYGEGSRGVVFVEWDGYSTGHYFNVSNENGNILYADGQNGATGDRVTKYFQNVKPSKTWLFRTDDKDIDEYVRKVVTWDGKAD